LAIVYPPKVVCVNHFGEICGGFSYVGCRADFRLRQGQGNSNSLPAPPGWELRNIAKIAPINPKRNIDTTVMRFPKTIHVTFP
jgi:hypothetical protein